jgi:hypothetical protein
MPPNGFRSGPVRRKKRDLVRVAWREAADCLLDEVARREKAFTAAVARDIAPRCMPLGTVICCRDAGGATLGHALREGRQEDRRCRV